jgi:GDP/UDP-N,N'-diacetylbacillosamine 2-epimerase (hydrolysing)
MRRKICFITGTRAEYGILKPLLEKIESSKNFDLSLIVTGLHLLPEYGNTQAEIKKKGFKKVHYVEMYSSSKKNQDPVKALSYSLPAISKILRETKPHFVGVVGDRLEAFTGAVGASLNKIPLVHIHGGEKTEGWHIDENIRHAITKLSNLHFTSTNESKKRVLNLGEESWRVYNVGALGLESFHQDKFSRREMELKFKIRPDSKLVLGIFNPPSLEKNLVGQVKTIVDSLEGFETEKFFIYPNNDPGSEKIIGALKDAEKKGKIRLFKNIDHEEYISLLKRANLLIGNSSSGIIEASFIGLPTINIGERNLKREHASNVIFVPVSKRKIVGAMEKVLEGKKIGRKLSKKSNLYGEGNSSEKIMKVLKKIPLGEKLIKKDLTY